MCSLDKLSNSLEQVRLLPVDPAADGRRTTETCAYRRGRAQKEAFPVVCTFASFSTFSEVFDAYFCRRVLSFAETYLFCLIRTNQV